MGFELMIFLHALFFFLQAFFHLKTLSGPRPPLGFGVGTYIVLVCVYCVLSKTVCSAYQQRLTLLHHKLQALPVRLLFLQFGSSGLTTLLCVDHLNCPQRTHSREHPSWDSN